MQELKINNLLKFLFVMFALFSFSTINGQQIFQKEYYGGSIWKKILENNDGYFFVGHSQKTGSYSHQIYIYHIDHYGNVIWAKHVGKNFPVGEFIYDYTFNQDTTAIVFVGQTHFSPGYQSILVFKLALNGSLLWHKSLGDSIINSPSCIYAYNGYFYIGGAAYYTNNGDGGLTMFLKLDENGNIIFEKFYSFPDDLVGVLGIYIDSSNIYMTGSWYDNITEERDVIFLKADSLGNLILSKKFNASQIDDGSSIIEDYDGNLILSGTTWISGGPLGYFAKMSKDGNLIWSKILEDGTGSSRHGPKKTKDLGYLVTLASAQIVKTDSLFNVNWSSRFEPGFLFRSLSNAQETRDGGIIAGGSVNNTFNSLIVKIDSNLTGGCNQIFPPINVYNIYFNEDTLPLIEVFPGLVELQDTLPIYNISNPPVTYCQTATNIIENEIFGSVNIFPNPIQNYFYIEILNNRIIKKVSIVDQIGNFHQVTLNFIDKNLISADEVQLVSGIYFLKIELETGDVLHFKIFKL